MKEVTLISDGACVGNPGPGGWAYILRCGEHSMERAGGTSDTTTNNRMEITAVIEGLKALKEPCEVLLISDSQYLLNGVTSWRFAWRRNGWMGKAKKGQERPVLNADLWQELDALAAKHTIRGQWVKGHSGHPDNERCDELADAQAAKYTDLPCWTGYADEPKVPTTSSGGSGARFAGPSTSLRLHEERSSQVLIAVADRQEKGS
jgi:ribonuclease HI